MVRTDHGTVELGEVMVAGRIADAAEDDGLGAEPLGAVNVPKVPI